MLWAEEFLKLYYWEEILELAGCWPEKHSLDIDLILISGTYYSNVLIKSLQNLKTV
jgi:hypothetical protein